MASRSIPTARSAGASSMKSSRPHASTTGCTRSPTPSGEPANACARAHVITLTRPRSTRSARMPLEGRRLAAPVSIRDVLRAGLDRDADGLAIVADDEQLTWRELEDRTERLAESYLALGLRAGDR